MLRRPLLSLLLALLLGGGFAYGLVRLFVLRYEMGDVYPPYSSLRADPLGTKALAAALDELPDVEVRRNFKPLPKLQHDGPVTLIYTGVPHGAFWTEHELLAFDALVASGSRAVFTFFPVENLPTEQEEKQSSEEERVKKKKQSASEQPEAKKKKSKDRKTDDKPEDGEKNEKEMTFVEFGAVAKRWGFNFGFLPADKEGAYHRRAALVEPGGLLESDISWHSALYFRDLKPHWKVLYMCGTMPVIMERRYGGGSIVLVADSYLVSNEALRKERHSRLLARLFAGPPIVIFDEESHGLRDNPGIASLARKYRLHGVIAGLVLLAVFFVWKNVLRFIPAYETPLAGSEVVAGKEAGEGFINLLRRAIRPSAVFDTCVAEWRKAFAQKPRELVKVEEIIAQEQARPLRQRDPIAAYRAISRALVRR
jgi:hypothetical protein